MVSNEETVTLDKIMVCPDTIKTGWGMWNGTYNTEYSDKPFIKTPKPDDGYKEAFSINLYTNDKRQFYGQDLALVSIRHLRRWLFSSIKTLKLIKAKFLYFNLVINMGY